MTSDHDPSPDPPTISFHRRPHGPAGKYTVDNITTMLEKFGVKMQRRAPIKEIEVYVDEPKNPVGKPVQFSAMLHVHCWSGKRYVAKAESYGSRAKRVGLETCVRDAVGEIEEQIRRDHGTR